MTTTNETPARSLPNRTKVQAKTIVETVFASITAAATLGAETCLPACKGAEGHAQQVSRR